jgi:hypothetical protein
VKRIAQDHHLQQGFAILERAYDCIPIVEICARAPGHYGCGVNLGAELIGHQTGPPDDVATFEVQSLSHAFEEIVEVI